MGHTTTVAHENGQCIFCHARIKYPWDEANCARCGEAVCASCGTCPDCMEKEEAEDEMATN